MRMIDLVKSFGEDIEMNIIGIRPGKKLHEVMCPVDDSRLTLEFSDHFVIRASITFSNSSDNFTANKLGEQGKTIAQGLEYNSGRNSHFLTIQELCDYNKCTTV